MDKLKEKMEAIEILDRDYFHTSITIKPNEEIEWTIYYKNLPDKVFLSAQNKPLLSSDKNTIEDIKELKERFETEKNKEANKHIGEIINIGHELFLYMQDTKINIAKFMITTIILLLSLPIINICVVHSVALSTVTIVLVTVIGILSNYYQRKIAKLTDEKKKEFIRKYIKEKIQHQGLYFVQKLKREERTDGSYKKKNATYKTPRETIN